MNRTIHRMRTGHWPEPVVANFTPYDCRICSVDEIADRARRQSEMEHEVANWNANAMRILRERGDI